MSGKNKFIKKFVSFAAVVALLLGQVNYGYAVETEKILTQQSNDDTMVGSVKVQGDKDFDCDTLRNSDSDQWRWISYPESRMEMNYQARATETAKYDGGMNLNMVVLVNGIQKKNNVHKIQMGPKDGVAGDFNEGSLKVAWYPYKLTAEATYSKGKVYMDEFFADKNTYIRLIDVTEAKDAKMKMSARRTGISRVGNDLVIDENHDWMVLKFLKLNEQGEVVGQYTPVINGDDWYVETTFDSEHAKLAFSLTMLPKNVKDNSKESTQELADKTVGQGTNINKLLLNTKKFWDEKLGKVPVPENFGFSGNRTNGTISAEKHRKSFYAAWAFQYQNIVEPTPEKGYNYYQVTLGKASTWGSGSASAPNSCSWESLFNIQELSYVEPEIAWDAMKGFIYSIDDNGILDGECLPSQKAHTTWLCYRNMIKEFPEREEELNSELNSLYAYIYKYLVWRADNPRWIYGNENFKNEKDISFVTQWYSDVDYAIKIAEKLGKYNDVANYERMKAAMGENARKWFFAEYDTSQPDSRNNRIKAFCFLNDNGTNSYSWPGSSHNATSDEALNYVYEALLAEFPKDLTDKLVHSYLAFTDGHEEEPLLGFKFYKYGDGCHTAYGLLEKELEYPELSGKWKDYINAVLANAIKNVDFAECLRVSGDSTHLEGVEPSSFNASAVIDYTYMMNGMRIDLGDFVAIGGDDLVKTKKTDVDVYTLKGVKPQLPKMTKVSCQGVEQYALVVWPDVKETQYDGDKKSFTVEGKIYGTDIKVTAKVHVYTNVALNKNATAGSRSSEAGKAVDGNLSTRWGDSEWSNEHWFQVDLGKRYALKALSISYEVSYAKDFEVKISEDGRKWRTIRTVTNNETLDWNYIFDEPVYASYIRIDASKTSNEEWGFSIWELGVYGQEEYENVALDKRATAGSKSDEAGKAVDGDISTRWGDSAWSKEHWFQVDLGNEYFLKSIKIAFEESYAKDFVIKVSNNGVNWKTVKIVSDNNVLDWSYNFDEPICASYIRIDASRTSNEEWGFSIWEFEAYGKEEIVSISNNIAITGYQMTSALNNIDGNMGFRTVYQAEPQIDGQTATQVGLVYGLVYGDNPITKKDVVYDSDNPYVRQHTATENGKSPTVMGDSDTASYYVLTMDCGNGTGSGNVSVNAYTTQYYVRAYAKLKDGSIVYSKVKAFTIYDVADFLYQNQFVKNKHTFDCLYQKILRPVNSDYEERQFNWSSIIVK